MTKTQDPVSDEALLKLALDRRLPDHPGACRSTALDTLEVSGLQFMAFLATIEELCHGDLTDLEVARCVTLGEVIDCLRAKSAARLEPPRAGLTDPSGGSLHASLAGPDHRRRTIDNQFGGQNHPAMGTMRAMRPPSPDGPSLNR